MKINHEATQRILIALAILIVVAGGVSCLFLNKAQQIIVAGGVVFGLINLLGLSYFFRKNSGHRRRRNR